MSKTQLCSAESRNLYSPNRLWKMNQTEVFHFTCCLKTLVATKLIKHFNLVISRPPTHSVTSSGVDQFVSDFSSLVSDLEDGDFKKVGTDFFSIVLKVRGK